MGEPAGGRDAKRRLEEALEAASGPGAWWPPPTPSRRRRPQPQDGEQEQLARDLHEEISTRIRAFADARGGVCTLRLLCESCGNSLRTQVAAVGRDIVGVSTRLEWRNAGPATHPEQSMRLERCPSCGRTDIRLNVDRLRRVLADLSNGDRDRELRI